MLINSIEAIKVSFVCRCVLIMSYADFFFCFLSLPKPTWVVKGANFIEISASVMSKEVFYILLCKQLPPEKGVVSILATLMLHWCH